MKAYLIVREEYMDAVYHLPAYKSKYKAKKELLALIDKQQESVVRMREFCRQEKSGNENEYKDFRLVSEDTWEGHYHNMTRLYIEEIEVV